MIFYFSGTGNSRYCAKRLAHRLGDEAVDAFPFLRDDHFPALTSRSPWVFVSPTYGWQLPRIFEALLRGGRFSGSRDAYFVMTCGAEIGDPIPRLEALCRDMGLTYRGVLPVVMPENYIALFRAPGPELIEQAVRDGEVPIHRKGHQGRVHLRPAVQAHQQVAGLDAAVEHLHVIKLRGVLNMDLRMGLHCGPYPVY